MDYITDIKEDVKKYLKSLGYEVVDGDLFLLDNSIQTVKYQIGNKTNQKKVPEGLKYVWINRSVAEFLNFKLKMNQLDIPSLNFNRIAKEISEGKTKVVFDDTKSTGDKFEVYLMNLLNYGEEEILRFRRLVW
nr:MAG TPA: Ribose/Galactose Isomerase [Caudoviricetes sp.]